MQPQASAIRAAIDIPTGYATSEPRGGESPEKRAKTAEMWLASEQTLPLQRLEGVEARGLIWDSHTSLG